MTDWTIIRRSLSSRPFVTITTTLTVGVAVALMLVLLGLKDSTRRAFDRGGGNMHMLVSTDASPLVAVLNGLYYAGSPRRAIPFSQYEEISRRYSPSDVPPGMSAGFAIPVQIGDSYRGQPVLATTSEFFTLFQPAPGEAWKFGAGGAFANRWEIVAGSDAARSAGLRVGSKVHLTHGAPDANAGGAAHTHDEFSFVVVGVLEPTGTAHDRAIFTDLASSWMIHAFDRREAAETAPANAPADHGEPPIAESDLTDADRKITGIFLRVPTRTGSDVSAVSQQVFDTLRRDPTITVAMPRQEIDKLFSIIGSIDTIVYAIAGVVLLAGGISIAVAMYNSMEQRRRQIAILRVLGCSRPRIFMLILTESALLAIIGGVGGLGLAVVGGVFASELVRRRAGLSIHVVLSPDATVAVIAGTVILGAAAGLIPAILAYRTPVANNLRPIG